MTQQVAEEAPAEGTVSEEEAEQRIKDQGDAQVAGGARRATQIPAGLAQKLVTARKAVERVAKKGKNTGQNYDYVRAEDVIDEAKKGLDEAEIVVLMEIANVETERISSSSGGGGKLVTVDFEISVIDGESGEGYVQNWKGAGADYPGDKAIYKAQTGATKYFLASLLGIPFGDDPETTISGSNDGGGGKPRPASDKQIAYGVKLLTEAELPDAAKEAIKVWIGGTEPEGAKVSRLIELLKKNGDDYNPAQLVKEAGWNGEVAPAATPSSGEAEKSGSGSAPAPAHENDARVIELTGEISKAPGLTIGQVVELMKATGITPPEGEKPDRAAVMKVLREISDEDNTKLTQAVVKAREAKVAAEAATGGDPGPEEPSEPDAPAESSDATEDDKPEVDPNTVLGQTVKAAESLGVDHLLDQLAELMYDLHLGDVPDEQLIQMTSLLSKADQAGITAAGLAACIRSGIEKNDDVLDRQKKFREWVDSKLETKAQTDEADKAGEAAEAPQE